MASVAGSDCGHRSALNDSVDPGPHVADIKVGSVPDDQVSQFTWLVPTLIAPMGVLEAADRGVELAPQVIEKATETIEAHRSSVARAMSAGVKIAMGTDSGVTPHGQNLRELAEMSKLGMSDDQVLRSSTSVAADLLGVSEDLGSIETGKLADLVIWDGSNLDVRDMRSRIHTIIQNGTVVAGRTSD